MAYRRSRRSDWNSDDSDLVDPMMYRQLIGSLMYLVNMRPYICFVVSTLSQYMCEPRQTHWVVAKHVLRYLHGTIGYGLRYMEDSDMHLVDYTDSDWPGSVDLEEYFWLLLQFGICCYFLVQ